MGHQRSTAPTAGHNVPDPKYCLRQFGGVVCADSADFWRGSVHIHNERRPSLGTAEFRTDGITATMPCFRFYNEPVLAPAAFANFGPRNCREKGRSSLSAHCSLGFGDRIPRNLQLVMLRARLQARGPPGQARSGPSQAKPDIGPEQA
ncbi:hypothetical protein FB451DRAFT_1170357 [Mycena latifolia]|nr:hypothetical protein FB451DRAFT_1170357 [Mycena latifolia]